jgi:protein-S-isoprenylcysteine O-methyltransferase Ste14
LGAVALVWGAWCVQHSLLNSERPLGRTRILRSRNRPYYRILYNVFAVLTLILASEFTPRGHEFSIIVWQWPLRLIPVVVWTVGLLVFWLTFRCLDWRDFLGLRGIGLGFKKKARSEGQLIARGIYSVVRHPQFAAGLMLLWVRDLRDTDLVINVVLSVYLIVGARIEEGRLVSRFGDEYIRYREAVPAFVPAHIPRLRELLR